MLGHVCEIIWAVTPPDKGVINKNHFPAVLQPPRWFLFLLAGCISLRAPVRSVSARPRGHPVIPRRRFHTKRKKKRPDRCVCCDQLGLPWWMDAGLRIRCQPCESGGNTARCSWVFFLTVNTSKGIKKSFYISIFTSGTVPMVTGHTHKSASQEEPRISTFSTKPWFFFPKHYSLKNKLDTQRAALMFQFAVQELKSANKQMPSFYEAITKTFSIKLGASLLCTTPMILHFQTLWSYIIQLQSPANTLIGCCFFIKRLKHSFGFSPSVRWQEKTERKQTWISCFY